MPREGMKQLSLVELPASYHQMLRTIDRAIERDVPQSITRLDFNLAITTRLNGSNLHIKKPQQFPAILKL
jgi:hypothetical protein